MELAKALHILTFHVFDTLRCTIQTPQFHGRQDKFHYHIQTGYINRHTWKFTPDNFLNGNHYVQFRDEADFNKACIYLS